MIASWVRHSDTCTALWNVGLIAISILLDVIELSLIELLQFELVMRSWQHVLGVADAAAACMLRFCIHTTIILSSVHVVPLNLSVSELLLSLIGIRLSSLVIGYHLLVKSRISLRLPTLVLIIVVR